MFIVPATLFSSGFESQRDEKFFAGRLQSLEKRLVLIRLELPSLVVERYERLGAAEIGAPLDLNLDLKQRILEEQEKLEKKLFELSSEMEVVYRYKYLMNALAVAVPFEFVEDVYKLDAVSEVQTDFQYFHPPEPVKFEGAKGVSLDNIRSSEWYTTVDHVKGTHAHEKYNVRGQGMRIGVIDSGIDYTHSMFAGPGDPDLFSQIDRDSENEFFPNTKVRGGIDLVGNNFSPSSLLDGVNIPRPNPNPLDSSGHGTHVAGSIAGIGDGVKSYSGVAPEALIYAMKVFGGGPTSDIVVAQAMEYAMDPYQNGDTNKRMDVVNLSLGGSFGIPQGVYGEVVKNAVRAGIVVVAAAGNSGPTAFVTGSPSTADDAIAVGASVDGMEKNWRFPGIDYFSTDDGQTWSMRAYEAVFTRPVERSRDVSGELVYAGMGTEPFTGELAERIQGSVALMSRGEVSFADKIRHAYEAGAIAVVIFNNQPGEPILMGGESEYIDIPATMIDLDLGSEFVDRLEVGEEIIVNFDGDDEEYPELIDQIASFSSYGPRSNDALLKPEIMAPGQEILSAQARSGSRVVALSGTSMAAPHAAGAAALIAQFFRENGEGLTALELKDLMLNTSYLLNDNENDRPYSLTGQGAGHIDVKSAIESNVIVTPSIISLGYLDVGSQGKSLSRVIHLRALSDNFSAETLQSEVEYSLNMDITSAQLIQEKSGVSMLVSIDLSALDDELAYYEAVLKISDTVSGKTVARVPVFGVNRVNAEVEAKRTGAKELTLSTTLSAGADVYPFLYMGEDEAKPEVDYFGLPILANGCDLREVYARVQNDTRRREEVLEIAIVIDQPVTMWFSCDISAVFDLNGDGKDDLEWVATTSDTVPGGLLAVGAPNLPEASFLVDAKRARQVRSDYEDAVRELSIIPDPFRRMMPQPQLNYGMAMIDYGTRETFGHRRVAIMQMPVNSLPVDDEGVIDFSLYVSNNYGGFLSDDRWGDSSVRWNIDDLRRSTLGLPQKITVTSDSEFVFETDELMPARLALIAPLNAPGEEVLHVYGKNYPSCKSLLDIDMPSLEPSFGLFPDDTPREGFSLTRSQESVCEVSSGP